jgi:hypothetical protein
MTVSGGITAQRAQQEIFTCTSDKRYDASGVFTGSQTGKIALKLGVNGDEFTATSAIQVFDANGNVVFTGCGTPSGTRFGGD